MLPFVYITSFTHILSIYILFPFAKNGANHLRYHHGNRTTWKPVDIENPIHMVVPLPITDDEGGGRNPFRMSIGKAQPIIDYALEKVYELGLLPNRSIVTTYLDTNLSDATGPNMVIQQLLKDELDVVVGFSYSYALAPIARMANLWKDGIPVITPIGLTTSLDDKTEYELMTRINTPYKVISKAIDKWFDEYKWNNHVFFFNHVRTALVPSTETFLLMSSLLHKLRSRKHVDHNFFTFNEGTNVDILYDQFKNGLMSYSFLSNGESFFIFFVLRFIFLFGSMLHLRNIFLVGINALFRSHFLVEKVGKSDRD